MRWLVVVLPAALIGGCVLDVSGTGETSPATSTGTTTTTDTTTTTPTGTGSGSTTTTTTSAGGSGGTLPAPVCNDGVVEPPEECEDGNLNDDDGCSSTCTVEASCGNDILEPGEECDTGTECVSCTVQAPSACTHATPLLFGSFTGNTSGSPVTSFGDVPTDFPSGDCTDALLGPVALYRYEVGPYPSGLALFVHGTGGPSFTNAVAWSYAGCAAEPVGCRDDSRHVATYDAVLFTPVQPPHTVLYVGIAEWASGQYGTFGSQAYPIRFGAWFGNDGANPGFVFTDDWYYDGTLHELVINSSNPANQATATSPSFYVGGIDTLQIAFQDYLGIGSGTSAGIEASFDGGPWQPTSFWDVTTGDVSVELDMATVDVPDGAMTAEFRFVFTDDEDSSAGWSIAGVFAGPAI